MIGKDARLRLCWCPFFLFFALGAKHVTPNFDVEAPTAAIAEKVAQMAERCREELAVEWLGHSLPNWSARCKVRVRVGQMGAGGATTFSFANGHVYGWDMIVQGSLERILDSVIPHEVSHTIFACHFRRPLPRWADEGAATLSEEDSERRRQQKLAEEMMPSSRRIPLRELLQITEYPKNMQHVLTLYAEGYSLADYLVQRGGKAKFLTFLQESFDHGWDAAIRRHYKEQNIETLENQWSRWVVAGSPSLRLADGDLLAQAGSDSPARNLEAETKGPRLAAKPKAIGNNSINSAREPITALDAGAIVRSQTPDAKLSDDQPHTPRGADVSAPEPRRQNGSGARWQSVDALEASNPPSPFSVVRGSSIAEESKMAFNSTSTTMPLEPRRPRAAHLTTPELRRPADR